MECLAWLSDFFRCNGRWRSQVGLQLPDGSIFWGHLRGKLEGISATKLIAVVRVTLNNSSSLNYTSALCVLDSLDQSESKNIT